MSDIRDIAQAFRAQSKSLSALEVDVSNASAALENMSLSLQELPELTEKMRELLTAVAPLPNIMKGLGTLSTQVLDLTARLNHYVDSTAEGNGRIRARLAALEESHGKR